MIQYTREEIESILQTSYYDRRTDYVWKTLVGDAPELESILYPIPNLERFQVMHTMLKTRVDSVADFLEAWEVSEHSGLLDCQYNPNSGILRVKARSFVLTYRSKLDEFHFSVYAKIAKSIGLKNRITQKKYLKRRIFPLHLLRELDEQLYSRYSEKEKVKAWRKTPQFKIDCQYCEAMIPFIMQDAEKKVRHLGNDRQLNIILHDNDKVRIGIARDYSPEEMLSMPCYPREQWQEGIRSAFALLEKEYAAELEAHRIKMQEWSDELSKIIVGKTPFCIEERRAKYSSDHLDDTYSKLVLAAALGNEEEFMATLARNEMHQMKLPRNAKLNKVMMDLYASVQQDRLREHQASMERKNMPQHALLVEEMKYIIQQSAPLIAYTGPNQMISTSYHMQLYVAENDSIRVFAGFTNSHATETFTLDSYQTAFRVWWSQLLLKECKYAKQCALNPEEDHPFDIGLPF